MIRLDNIADPTKFTRDSETGLVYPPWLPEQVKAGMSLEKRKMVQRQQTLTIKARLGKLKGSFEAPADSDLLPDADEDVRQWLKIEFEAMKAQASAGGHSHGPHGHGAHGHGPPPAMALQALMASLSNALPAPGTTPQPLELPTDIDLSAPLSTDEEIVLPPWLPNKNRETIKAMSKAQRRAFRRQQVISIRASCGTLKGSVVEPTEGDLTQPTDDETREWIATEWRRIKALQANPPELEGLLGQWAYGRRSDGAFSSYVISCEGTEFKYTEIKADGGVLRGKVRPSTDELEGGFTAFAVVEFEGQTGTMWLRVIDGVTIQSLFRGQGAQGEGFKANARRVFSGIAGATETPEVLLSGPIERDEESGLIIPPWADNTVREAMQKVPPVERTRIKATQDQIIRMGLKLEQGKEVGEEHIREWLKQGYLSMLEQQSKLQSMSPEQRMQYLASHSHGGHGHGGHSHGGHGHSHGGVPCQGHGGPPPPFVPPAHLAPSGGASSSSTQQGAQMTPEMQSQLAHMQQMILENMRKTQGTKPPHHPSLD